MLAYTLVFVDCIRAVGWVCLYICMNNKVIGMFVDAVLLRALHYSINNNFVNLIPTAGVLHMLEA